MENTLVRPQSLNSEEVGKGNVFLQANTIEMDLNEIRDKHIIPVFLKDNEPAISQVEFVEAVTEAARDAYSLRDLSAPSVRVSHAVKGRIYEARHKKASELFPNEKTIYYERLAFMVTIPTIMQDVNGQLLELTVGGVKAYNLDNMNTNKGSYEHFKIFVGFKNTVCTNLCISTDGTKLDLKVKSLQELYAKSFELFTGYDAVDQISRMEQLSELDLSESQFAKLIGRARMYQYLPKEEKLQIPELLINDTQISRVAESYYSDENFSRYESGRIDLWRLYNLMTGAVKSSYIDKFLEREVNAYDFTLQIHNALENKSDGFWYLN
ncbi:DUF3871 family protein [Algoriphagus sp. NF]|uniref:DUF3871 family protein n=1 Tax=Algoriphagus sp. NF TaxID=2992756 RepID=UPI00237BFF37|nr:DUF3871 family protein [Algoriphagus sp. NF]MDE0561755.1 DUF3871 family protein [Algoriphagus sp. NF]